MPTQEEVPWHERRLQKPSMHRQHYSVELFPETRKIMMRQHASQSVKHEYLQPGQQPAPYVPVERSERIFDIVNAVQATGTRMLLKDGRWELIPAGVN
jgi:hypothetical protein